MARPDPRSARLAPAARLVALEPADQLAGLQRFHPVPVLDRQRVLDRERPLLVRREPVAAEGGLGPRGHVVRERDCRRQRLSRLGQPVGQSHAQSLVTAHASTGKDQVEGVAVADQPGQAHGAAVHERDAPAPAVDPEDGVLGRHAQIAPGRDSSPPATA